MHAHSEARDGLIGWLPEELVLFHVLPRLPWYTRPVCRAVSKSWRALIDACKTMGAAELELKTRQYQLPLLRGLFLICTSDTQVFITRQRVGDERKGATYHTVEQLSDPFEREWGKFDKFIMHRQIRSLPPLGQTLPSCCDVEARLLASSGRVYVWFDYERPDFVLKMDMGCGDWTWNKIAVPHPFCSDAIDFNGKIYMPLLLTEGSDFVQDSASQEEKEAVLVFDTMTDRWKHVETWNHKNLRVLRERSSYSSASTFEEKLYSFTERQSVSNQRLEVSVYDASQDSWRLHADITIIELVYPQIWQVELLNSDCFEPAAKTDNNVVWIAYGMMEIASFDPSSLFLINYEPEVEGGHLEYVQFVRGSIYGIFLEAALDLDTKEKKKKSARMLKRRTEDGNEMWKRTMKKGKICVTRSIVQWEEVLEIGYFEEDPLITHFTMMA